MSPTGTGWSGRRVVPTNWKGLRTKVMRRDDHRCTSCGQPAVQVDHIIPVAEGGSHDLDNLAAICQSCHDGKTKAESARGRRRAAAKRKASRHEPHPGVIPSPGDELWNPTARTAPDLEPVTSRHPGALG